ncbi:unnamed protein product [Echinostoma caproni]|uniref:UBX domain-containing protein n=1 Tax=Echinostoma caproni TaxID=27848 RepID=A0A183AXC2_9TREM|nr:unnamed protein product [Echinostoma caproni]
MGGSQSSSGDHGKTQSEEERFLIACRSGESARSCGSAPLWVEGIATSGTTDRGGWFLRPTPTNNNVEQNRTIHDRISPLSMSGIEPPLRFVWQLDPPQPTSVARLAHVLDGFSVESNEASYGMLIST